MCSQQAGIAVVGESVTSGVGSGVGFSVGRGVGKGVGSGVGFSVGWTEVGAKVTPMALVVARTQRISISLI